MNNKNKLVCRNCGLDRPTCGHHLFEAKGTGENTNTGGSKADQGKPRFDLVPSWPLEQLAAVMAYGATTYGDHNWRRGLYYSRLYAAAQRHMNAFWAGKDIDRDSGLPHMAHAAANMLMLLEFHHRGYDALGFDDRMREALSAAEIQALVQVSAA